MFEYITYFAWDIKKTSKASFVDAFSAIDWETLIGHVQCPDRMTEILHQTIDDLTNKLFPMKKRRVKSKDAPWITDEIKRAIRRRKRRFKKNTEEESSGK